MSILDRDSAAREQGEELTLFHNHKSWGSGGRMRIYAELKRQEAINAEEQELTLHDSDATSDTYAVRSIVLENGQRNEDLSNGDPVIIEVEMPSNGCKN